MGKFWLLCTHLTNISYMTPLYYPKYESLFGKQSLWGWRRLSIDDIIITFSTSFQMRYLQTLNSISAENNSTIIFPIPIDIISQLMGNPPQGSQQVVICIAYKFNRIFSDPSPVISSHFSKSVTALN